MSVPLTYGREERAGKLSGRAYCTCQHAAHPGLPLCFVLALLACAVAHAEESFDGMSGRDALQSVQGARAPESPPPAQPDQAAPPVVTEPAGPSIMPPRMVVINDDPDLPIPVHASRALPEPAPEAEPIAINLASIDRVVERFNSTPLAPLVHVEDSTTATGLVDSRARSMALALDAPLSRGGTGLTLQSRVEMAYRPGTAPVPGNWDAPPGEVSATGLAVRLYGSKPTRLNGVYPFVEADWWQDNRARTININGTRIDTDLLRGLFSFNIGAHSNSTTGLKLWMKARGGRNAGGTLGARYRW
ncbi:MAG: hypothetical protein INH13_20895 [Cupriavidus sp.]|nr:hypothetical protein [Cupriavidus sp.]